MADEYNSDSPRAHDTVERTTIVETNRGGGGGALAVVILLIAVLALLYLFRNELGLGSKTTNVNIPDKIQLNVN